jgi:hypothetical protein
MYRPMKQPGYGVTKLANHGAESPLTNHFPSSWIKSKKEVTAVPSKAR